MIDIASFAMKGHLSVDLMRKVCRAAVHVLFVAKEEEEGGGGGEDSSMVSRR